MAAIGILAFMLASGPVELGVFRDDVEQAITNARDGRPVTVDRLTLQWSPSERRVFIVADGLSIKDLEPMIGQPNRVYEVLSHKRPLTLRMIRNLNKGLGISAQVLITDNMRTQRTPST